MKIVHLCLSSFYIDDYSYQENMLPKYHVLQGHEVSVVASLVSFDSQGRPCLLQGESEFITKDGFKVIRLDYKRPFYNLNKFIRIYHKTYEVLERETPDLIFIHDFSFMDITEIIRYLKRHPNVRVFVDCHTDYINSAQSWVSKNIFHHVIWRYYAKKLSQYVEKFYGVTPLRCDFLRTAYKIDPKKNELLVMGIDDVVLRTKNRIKIREAFLNKHNINENDFIVVTGGKIDERKNIHLVMQAMTEIEDRKVKLVVFGTVEPKMQELFSTLLMSENIIYIGWLSADDILDYFILSDLVVFPGTHSVLWEQAVGAGIPCLFKYWEGMTHIDVGGNCKFIYKDDYLEIKRLINGIVSDNDAYSEMKDIAMRNGLKKFSYDDIARRAIV